MTAVKNMIYNDFIVAFLANHHPYCQIYRKDGEPIRRNFSISERGGWPFPYLKNDKSFWIAWEIVDKNGIVWVSWMDYRSGNYEIFGRRL